ncbi:MAG: aminotransferase class I/II-fold pyridoxal phosphate-dependent enzyme, partial [Bacteroidales bacterium]|nr:aminotransferase class I/II-fold pyridoxal phosphate-dependent enzyme [Bacteroidales bacterium]
KTCAVPGLRIGYVVARPVVIDRLRRFVRPWSVGALSALAAKWLADNDVHAVADRRVLLAEAARLSRRLSQLPGISVMPSATTFMLVRCEAVTATELKERLVQRYGILVRDASNFRTLDHHYIRVATQRPEDNDQLVAAVCGLMNKEKRITNNEK